MAADTDTVAVIETKFGKMVVEFYDVDAPKTVANFIGETDFLAGTVLGLTGGQSVRLTGDEPLRVALALVDAMKDAADDDVFELAAVLAAHPEATFPELARAVLADGRFGRLDGAR